MTAFDYTILVIVVLSVGLGWWRGFVYELVSLLGWIAAYFVARIFALDITEYVPNIVTSSVAKTAVAYTCLFVATLIVSGILAWLLSKLVKLRRTGFDGWCNGRNFRAVAWSAVSVAVGIVGRADELAEKTFLARCMVK
jgi:uncharacterized membrane protein required for colicin V production